MVASAGGAKRMVVDESKHYGGVLNAYDSSQSDLEVAASLISLFRQKSEIPPSQQPPSQQPPSQQPPPPAAELELVCLKLIQFNDEY